METGVLEKKAVNELPAYQFKKQQDTGKFKVFQRDTDTLLEGYEDKEFNSPLEGGWFFKKLLTAADKTAGAEMKIGRGRPTMAEMKAKEAAEAEADLPEVPTQGFEIPIIEGQEPVIEVIGNTRYFEVIIREHDEPKRISEPITDGHNATYYVAMGKKVILPEAVINTAKDAVYTIIETHQDPKTMKCTNTSRESPRFSIEIIREVTAEEATKWLKDQKRTNIGIY